ncbi:MAG: NAD-dependent epimerase/dehydratase family protein [Myxococcota bacterium]|nr:NAD-dependent epimerase/dehydratase family protein [Myxococcota bacterium]
MLKGKQILITGGAGFIGTRLALRLVDDNRVVVLDTLHRNALTTSGLEHHPNLTLIKGDVRDRMAVKQAVRGATHIVHLASIAGVDTVMANPLLTMDVCIKGTFNLLETALETDGIERFVDFSTSEVFGRYAYNVTEGDVTSLGAVGEARWTYAVSKLATEHLCHVMYKQHELPTVTVRPFNIFGPGQVGTGAIHHFVVRAINNDPIEVHNNGVQIRAWCYIDDLIDGLLLTLSRPEAVGRTFNIGNPQTAVTVHHLARLIVDLVGSKSQITHIDWPFPDVELRVPDVSAAAALLNFQPKFDLNEGLQLTIDWYRKKIASSST